MAPGLTLIGLDAATLDVVEPLAAAGHLPNIGRILSGAVGPLRSTTHPITPHAWVTMATGVSVGSHGIWDFVERDETGYGFTAVNGSHRRAPALWDYLSETGSRVGLVSVPFTWPPPDVRGFAVSGFDTPAGHPDQVHPSALATEIGHRFGDYRLDDVPPVDSDGRFRLDIVQRACEAKAGLAAWLAERFDPDFLFVVFMAADYVQHHSWPEWEANGSDSTVADVYRTLDAAVGAVSHPDRNVMIVSDHGGGALKGVVSLNGWLAGRGYLAYRPERSAVSRQLSRVGARLRREPDRTVLDWSRTRAFAYGMFGNIVINLEGREAHGIVAAHDYDPLRGEIAKSLSALRSDDGEQIVAAVHRREELFEGPWLGKAPDLVVEFNDYAWLGTGSHETRSEGLWDTVAMRIGARGGWAGSHRPDGVFALQGPAAAAGTRLQARIADVAPTVLHILGQHVPAELEGRMISAALASHPVDGHAVTPGLERTGAAQPVRRYGATEAELVEARLRALGYVE